MEGDAQLGIAERLGQRTAQTHRPVRREGGTPGIGLQQRQEQDDGGHRDAERQEQQRQHGHQQLAQRLDAALDAVHHAAEPGHAPEAVAGRVAPNFPGPRETGLANPRGNTTIAIVATDAVLNKAQAGKLATMAHDGLARTIHPVHTMVDGDTLFALATGGSGRPGEMTVLGVMAAEVTSRAVLNAVRAATGLHTPALPAARDLAPT